MWFLILSCSLYFEILVFGVASVPEEQWQEDRWSTHCNKRQPVNL